MAQQLDDAQRALAASHVYLARLVAHDEHARLRDLLSREELESIALAALVEATLAFDRKRGTFKPFARKRMRARIIDAARKYMPEYAKRRYTAEQVLAGEHVRDLGLAPEGPSMRDAGVPLDLESIVDPATSTDSKFFKAELWATAEAVYDELSPENQDMARALYRDEMELTEYAQKLGVAVSTVKRRSDALRITLSSRYVRLAEGGG